MVGNGMESSTLEVDRLKTLVEINALINSSYSDINALLVYILESAMRLVECESSSLLLLDKDSSILRFKVALGPAGPKVMNIPVDINTSIAGWVVSNNKSLIVNDVQSDVRFSSVVQCQTGYKSENMIAVPIRVNGDSIGVIELLNKDKGQKFINSDLEILELLSIQVSVAYQNADKFLLAQNEIRVLQNTIASGFQYHSFIANSPVMLDLIKIVDEIAKNNSSVLILGESGVGKELFAEQLHLKSSRSQMPFVRVNCAALSPQLLESELFGHVKGAFTNAVSDRVGRFEAANGGTIFLDEIGELPLDLQVKLLRVIQSKSFEKVGSNKTLFVDVRIVAATNRDFDAMVQEGLFRKDLYYRLNVLPLYIPPLRNRKEDIEPLASFFCNKFSVETKKNFTGFSDDALKLLHSYYWPGNVRELENTIERACVLGKPPLIKVEDFRLFASQESAVSAESAEDSVDSSYSTGDRTLKTAVNRFKKKYITKILNETSWNQTKACKILGIQRTYVSRLLNELNIRDDRT